MFKILTIHTLATLADERTEYLINDHLSFMPFLGLDLSGRVPNAKTFWLFRERLIHAGEIDGLFNRFDATLRNAGYLPMSGQILDATLVAAPTRLAGQSSKAVSQGSLPTLDPEIHQGETAGWRNDPFNGYSHPVLSL